MLKTREVRLQEAIASRVLMMLAILAVAVGFALFGGGVAWAEEPEGNASPETVAAAAEETAYDADGEQGDGGQPAAADYGAQGDAEDTAVDGNEAFEPVVGEGEPLVGDEPAADPQPASGDEPEAVEALGDNAVAEGTSENSVVPAEGDDDASEPAVEPAIATNDPVAQVVPGQPGEADEASAEEAQKPQVKAASVTAKPVTAQPATTQAAQASTSQKASVKVKAQATKISLSKITEFYMDDACILCKVKSLKGVEYYYLGHKDYELVKGKDFKVTFSNVSKVGKGVATFTGIGKFTGTVKKTYRVLADPYPSEKWWDSNAWDKTFTLRMPLNSTCTAFKNVVFNDYDGTGRLKISGSTLKALKTGTVWLFVEALDGTTLSDGLKVVVYKPTGEYTVKSALGNGLVLDVAGASTADGANVQVYKSNGTKAQHFKLVNSGSGTYTFVSAKSGKAVDVKAGSKSDGANVQQYKRNGTDAQKWRIKADLNGKLTFVNVKSGKALDVRAGSKANGTNVQQYKSNGTAAQKWTLSAVPSKYKAGATKMYVNSTSQWTLQNARLKVLSGKAVKVSGSTVTGVAKGSSVVAVVSPTGKVIAKKKVTVAPLAGKYFEINSALKTPCKAVWGQYASLQDDGFGKKSADVYVGNYNWDSTVFTFVRKGDAYEVIDANWGLALDVSGASKSDGANVQIYKRNNTAAQKWRIVVDADNLVTFINVNSGKVLDIAGAKYERGKVIEAEEVSGYPIYYGKVQQCRLNGTKAQKWELWD